MKWILCIFLIGAMCTTIDPVEVCAQTVEEVPGDSVQVAEAAVAKAPKDARAYVELGHAYLNAGRGDEALKAFRKAADLDGDLATAYNGLGLVHLKVRKDLHIAQKYFRQALQKDRSFIEPQYHIAKAHMDAGNHSAKGEAERLVKMDSTYAPGYLLLARWHEVRQKYEGALGYYRKYMALRPDDQEVGFNVGLALLAQDRYDEAEAFAVGHLNAGPRYAVLAQVLMHRQDFVKALQAFELYIDYLPVDEQALYRDISLVASAEEQKAYREVPEANRRTFLHRFWLKHEPDLVSGGRRRRAEHYRRIWHARTHFEKGQKPWDRRGEIYIRYGEPDYRSTSQDLNFDVPLEVQRIQEQRALELYGPIGAGVSFYGPVYPVRTGKVSVTEMDEPEVQSAEIVEFTTNPAPTGSVMEDSLGLARYRPVTSGFYAGWVPWEAWVYTQVEGGLEVVFTDETLNGRYDYAPAPAPTAEDFERLQGEGAGAQPRLANMLRRFQRFAPEVVVQRATSQLPEQYDIIRGASPLDFIYDLADFEGLGGRTRVEVYAGIPVRQFATATDTVVNLERAVALADSAFSRVYRARDDLRIRVQAGQVGVVVDQVVLGVPPGKYEMAVQVRQKGANRVQIFRQQVVVEGYPEGMLGLSDIQVARQVSESPPPGARFVKGGMQVSPAPGRTFYTGQLVYLYFEIYGLAADAFGTTRYEMTHTVRVQEPRPMFVQALSRLGQLLGAGEGEQEVTIRYEQTGTHARMADYVALDLQKAGAGEYRVQVAVKDVNGKQVAAKEAFFRLVAK